MPISPLDFLLDVIVPALLALAAMVVAWGGWRRFAPAGAIGARGHWGGALAFGLAVLAAYRPVFGSWPVFPPNSANPWLFYVTLLALLVGLLDALIRPPRWVATLAVFLATAAAMWAMLRFMLFTDETGAARSIGMLALLGLIGAIWWITFEVIADDGGVVAPLLMWIAASTVAVVFMLTDSLSWGKLALSLAAAAGAAVVMSLWRRDTRIAHGANHVFVIVMLSLIVAAHYIAELSIGKLIALSAIPAYVWIGRLLTTFGPAARWRPWQRAVIQLGAVAIPAAILLAVAAAQFRQTSGGSGEYDPYGMARAPGPAL